MAQVFPVASGWSDNQLADAPAIALPAAPAVADLDVTSQENYHLEISAAESLGFPIATLSSSQSHATLLLGTSRYKDVVGAANHVFRFGVSIRALIVVSALKIDFSLTLPIVAAKVQLGLAQASAELLVQGYKGALGADLPKWQDFDVDSYAEYMKAVSNLQEKVLNDTDNIVPELLATSAVVVPSTVPLTPVAIGVFYALTRIAEGDSLSHALDGFSVTDPAAREAVRTVYLSRVGGGDTAKPDETMQDAVHVELSGLHLAKEHFNFRNFHWPFGG